jgi:hypothetical protein
MPFGLPISTDKAQYVHLGTHARYDGMGWSINRWSHGCTVAYGCFVFYRPMVGGLSWCGQVESCRCLLEASGPSARALPLCSPASQPAADRHGPAAGGAVRRCSAPSRCSRGVHLTPGTPQHSRWRVGIGVCLACTTIARSRSTAQRRWIRCAGAHLTCCRGRSRKGAGPRSQGRMALGDQPLARDETGKQDDHTPRSSRGLGTPWPLCWRTCV